MFASSVKDAAGIPPNEWHRRTEFDLLAQPQRLLRHAGRQLLTENLWGLERLATGLRRRIRWLPNDRSRTPPPSDGVARRTLHVYVSNLAFIESLGRRYGFEPLFYWQPNLFSKRRRSPDEQAMFEHRRSTRKAFDDLYRLVRGSAALKGRSRFHDISALFDELAEPYYVDGFHHLSEAGNRLVAAAMLEDLIALIEQRRAADN